MLSQVPHFELLRHDGRTVTLSDFAGKPWVADFIFTRCVGMCPVMSGSMQRVAEGAPSGADLQLVSFSVDPEHDTPAVLREYADRFRADPEGWLFLTGLNAHNLYWGDIASDSDSLLHVVRTLYDPEASPKAA